MVHGPDVTNTDGEDSDGRTNLVDGVVDGPFDVIEETSGTGGLGLVLGTSGSTDDIWDTLGLSGGITNEGSGGILPQNLVVITIGKDDEDLGGVLSESGSGCGGGQHVGTVDNTRRDGSTRTAASSRGNRASEDSTLGVGSAL